MRRFWKAVRGFSFSDITNRSARGKERTNRSRLLRMEPLEQRTVLSIAVHSLAVDGASPQTHSLQINLSDPEFNFVDNGNGWQQIASGDLTSGGFAGNPKLPNKLLHFLLPADADLSSVKLQTVMSTEQLLPGAHKILPVDPPATTTVGGGTVQDYPPGMQIVNGQNMLVYGIDADYSLGTIVLADTQQMGKYKMADVYFSPFSYNPVSGTVKVAKNVSFALSYQSGDPEPAALMARSVETADAEDLLANFDDAAEWYPGIMTTSNEPTSPASYVIITTSTIASGSARLNDFVSQKIADGFTVQVVTESTWGGGTGNPGAENIRNWLKTNYASMGIQYVLLVGNPDPAAGNLPMKMLWPRNSESDDQSCPSDAYYADLTSNWDSDGDGKYGEYSWWPGVVNGDLSSIPAHEVNVGRIPVYGSSTADFAALDGVFQKIIDYERTSDITWRQNVLLPMAISNYANENGGGKSRTDGAGLGEHIKADLATPHAFGSYTLYEKAGLSPVSTACSAPLTETNLLNAWSNNPYGIVDWWGHGNSQGTYRKYWSSDDGDGVPEDAEMTWEEFISSSVVGTLNNNRPSIVTQVSCQNAWPEDPNNLAYSLLKNGAIATVAGTRNTWYWTGDWSPGSSGDNASYAYYITQRILANQTGETTAAALQWCRENLSLGLSNSRFMNALEFSLYGDPSTTIGKSGTEKPEMDVLGNAKNIADGDSTPSATDYTDFGTVNLAAGSVTRTFTIKNFGNAALNLYGSPKVLISGANAADFTIAALDQPASPVETGGSTTFKIKFDPSGTGVRTATVYIVNDDANEGAYDFVIQGVGANLTSEINLQGNSQDIVDGDDTPDAADFTDFGEKNVNGGAVSHTFYIFNTGTPSSNLLLTGSPRVVISGADAADFSVTAQPPTNILAGGSSTSFTISFTPTGPGVRTAAVSISNNDSNENPYDFMIQGVGVASEINVQGNGYDIADGDTTPDATDFTDFGSQVVVGGPVSHTFYVSNVGNSPLLLTGSPKVVISGANESDFAVTFQPSSIIAGGGSMMFVIAFAPIATGLRTATVSISNSDSNENPYDFTIQGIGLAAEIGVQGNGHDIVDGDVTPDVADFTDFGLLAVAGEPVSHTFYVFNTGNSPLLLTGSPKVVVSGANESDFTVTSEPVSLVDGGASTLFEIAFVPSGRGLRTATISISNSDSNENPYDFTIHGIGLAAEMGVQGNGQDITSGDITPDAADFTDFGALDVAAQTQSYTFTIQNTGNAALALAGSPLVEITGENAVDFTVTAQPASATVDAAGSLTFTVQFDPSGAGLRTATVRIVNSDSDENPYEFAIQGTGTVVSHSFTWDGGGADAMWSTPANWAGDVAPSPGSDLVFPAEPFLKDGVNDYYPLGIQFGSITVSGGDYHFQDYSIQATAVEVQGDATVSAVSLVCDSLTIGGVQAAASAPVKRAADHVVRAVVFIRDQPTMATVSVATVLSGSNGVSQAAERTVATELELTASVVASAAPFVQTVTLTTALTPVADLPAVLQPLAGVTLVTEPAAGAPMESTRRLDVATDATTNGLRLSRPLVALVDSVLARQAETSPRAAMQQALALARYGAVRSLALQSMARDDWSAVDQLDGEMLLTRKMRKQDKLTKAVDEIHAELATLGGNVAPA
jgi:hypothetical protein